MGGEFNEGLDNEQNEGLEKFLKKAQKICGVSEKSLVVEKPEREKPIHQ